MKALVVYCHPKEGSFTSAIRDLVLEKLTENKAEVRIVDLYANGFSPVLSGAELDVYEDPVHNTKAVAEDVANLKWCDTLIAWQLF